MDGKGVTIAYDFFLEEERTESLGEHGLEVVQPAATCFHDLALANGN